MAVSRPAAVAVVYIHKMDSSEHYVGPRISYSAPGAENLLPIVRGVKRGLSDVGHHNLKGRTTTTKYYYLCTHIDSQASSRSTIDITLTLLLESHLQQTNRLLFPSELIVHHDRNDLHRKTR